jgi:RNA polymerase sigma factor (TIGR02999 family)
MRVINRGNDSCRELRSQRYVLCQNGNLGMDPGNITRLIAMWRSGDKSAENALFGALYHRLHAIAVGRLRNEPRNRPLGATTLVHEAYLRLTKSENFVANDRHHFLALVAKVMRCIVIDKARERKSRKRGGEGVEVEIIEDELFASDAEADQILAVDVALKALAKRSPRQAQIVELRYFAGFDEEEVAAILKISSRTVRRDWDVARTRLRVAIEG